MYTNLIVTLKSCPLQRKMTLSDARAKNKILDDETFLDENSRTRFEKKIF